MVAGKQVSDDEQTRGRSDDGGMKKVGWNDDTADRGRQGKTRAPCVIVISASPPPSQRFHDSKLPA